MECAHSYNVVMEQRHNKMLPTGVIRKLLAKIKANEARFSLRKVDITHHQIQSTINKLSTTNVRQIIDTFVEIGKDQKSFPWVIRKVIEASSRQPLFRKQFLQIIEEILNKYPHYENIITHSIQLSIVHLFIRREIFIDTNVNAKEYLKLCKMNVIKKKCVGSYQFMISLQFLTKLKLLQTNFIDNCIHHLIESIYQHSNRGVSVECLIVLLEKIMYTEYIEEIHDILKLNMLEIRSQFLLLNAVDNYTSRTNYKLK